MKIYALDHGVYGSAVVVANSKGEAFLKIKNKHPKTTEFDIDRITEHEINENFSFANWGDM